MKVLNKYFKVVLCFMAFALCSFMFAFTPSLTAAYAVDYTIAQYNAAINAIKMPQEEVDYNVPGAKFKVPLLDTVLGNKVGDNVDDDKIADYTIRVIDPAGYKHDYVVGGDKNDTKYFGNIEDNNLIVYAKNDGEYKVVYIVTEGERTYYSNSYKVTVKNVSYELDFSTPVYDEVETDKIIGYDYNLIQTKLQKSETPYEIPVAYAKVIDGDVTNKKATIKVTKNGAPQEENAAESIFTSVTTGEGASAVTKYYITPSETGVYTIEYSYEDSVNRPTKTYTINVLESFSASDLTLASSPTLPSISLGKEGITLPKLTFNAGEEKNVDVNVKSIVIEKDKSDGEIACTLTNNNFKFDMTPANFGADSYDDMVGNYTITYTVEDAYGKTKTEIFTVDGVTVSSKPSIYLAYNYNKTDAKEDIVLGAETELKAEYVSNNEIVLPAVYAEDAVTENFDDFIIIRTIRKGSTYYYVDNYKYNEEDGTYMVDANKVSSEDKSFNASGDTNIGDVTKAVRFKFNTEENIEGTYYVEYRVISKEVKERESSLYITGTTEKYTFKVVSSHEATTPSVEITNLKDSSVKATDKITVKVSSKDDLDTRLKNAVFTYSSMKTIDDSFADYDTIKDYTLNDFITYAIGNVTGAAGYEKTTNILDDDKFVTEMNKYYNDFAKVDAVEGSKDNFALDLSEESGDVIVVAVALNDDGNVDTDSRVLSIKDTVNDDTAPVIKIHELEDIWKDTSDASNVKVKEFTVGQGEEVELPVVYVNDTDKTLSLNVMYYIDSPENSYGAINYKSPTGKNFYYDTIGGAEVQVIDGGTITTSETGVYYVAYTATDAAGNTSVMYFTFVVEDTSKPILSVEAVGDDITQSGNTVEGGKGTVVDFEATLRSADGKNDYTDDAKSTIKITIDDNGKGLDYQPSGNSKTSYVFNDYGTYVVTITGSYDGRDADSKVIRITITKEEIKWLSEFDVPQYAAKDKEVYLPDVAASNNAVVTVSVTAPGGSAPTEGDAEKVTDDNGFTYWVFKTNKESKGTYTVTYTATTDEDVLTKTFSIKVGDNVAPVMSFNKGELEQDLIYDGENDIEYVLEVNKSKKTFVVKAINDGKEVYSYNIGLVISDKDDTASINSNMSWTNLKYELTGDNVTAGETTSTSAQYFIKGTGKCTLKLTMKDSYDNESVETIEFNVVTETKAKENNDTVVGAVLIVVSLVLLAGVILFFAFTGRGGKGTKVKKTKTPKVEKKTEEVVETEVVKEDEAKSGDVE